jgi:hypothetical protein
MKHRRIGFIRSTILAAAVLTGLAAGAQQRPLSLTEALDLSVKNSKALKGSSARIAEAQASLQ